MKMIEIDKLRKIAKENDANWDKVMNLARENGFVTQAYGGTAVLVSNNEQIRNYGYKDYVKIQKANGLLEEVKVEDEREV